MGTDWNNKDLEDALRKAFKSDPEGSILIDGHEARNKFKRDGITYALEQGWLYKSSEGGDEQYTALYYSLTDKGKDYFGV